MEFDRVCTYLEEGRRIGAATFSVNGGCVGGGVRVLGFVDLGSYGLLG